MGDNRKPKSAGDPLDEATVQLDRAFVLRAAREADERARAADPARSAKGVHATENDLEVDALLSVTENDPPPSEHPTAPPPSEHPTDPPRSEHPTDPADLRVGSVRTIPTAFPVPGTKVEP